MTKIIYRHTTNKDIATRTHSRTLGSKTANINVNKKAVLSQR